MEPSMVKAFFVVVSDMVGLVLLRANVHNHSNLFVAAKLVHTIGITLLIYKLSKQKTCAGLSLKSQELIPLFFAVRLYCSFVMEYDIHTLLALSTLAAMLWPFLVWFFLAILIHPSTPHNIIHRIFWAFCVYLEAVRVLPQLRVMQNTKIVDPFTSHYVFALKVLDSHGHLLTALGYGLWPSLFLVSETVQTFILADFCYYYVKSVFGGQTDLRLPTGTA